ncbi:MMPL family transporter [Paenibacillus senegalensis]|uniref:MMPL family transporter n=1 Tax=Paenibacillus senegalensis TaxID=1465766 RepID=UPI00028818D2|nr:MMPL family transporter [Paenibacillus senegalensis]
MYSLLARLSVRYRKVVILGWLAILLGFAGSAIRFPTVLKDAGLRISASYERASEIMSEHFHQSEHPVLLLFESNGSGTDEQFAGFIKQALSGLASLEGLHGVQSPLDYADMRSGRWAYASLSFQQPAHQMKPVLEEIRSRLPQASGFSVTVTGKDAVWLDVSESSQKDLVRAEWLGIPLAFGVLWLAFGGLISSLIPILVGLIGVAGTFGILYQIGRGVDLSLFVLNVIPMVGLALSIDFALLVVSRFREEFQHRPLSDAMDVTMNTAGRTVMLSALCFLLGLAGMLFIRLPIFYTVVLGAVVVLLFSLMLTLTLVPALLAAFAHKIKKERTRRRPHGMAFTGIKTRSDKGAGVSDKNFRGSWGQSQGNGQSRGNWEQSQGKAQPRASWEQSQGNGQPRGSREHHGWYRLAGWLMKRPVTSGLLALVVLVIGVLPLGRLQLAIPDTTSLPHYYESRQAAELIEKHMTRPDRTKVLFVLEGEWLAQEKVWQSAHELVQELSRDPQVLAVDSLFRHMPVSHVHLPVLYRHDTLRQGHEPLFERFVQGNYMVVAADVGRSSQSKEARNWVREQENRLSKYGDLNIYIGGDAKYEQEVFDQITDHLLPVLLFILVAIYLVLLFAFRSIWVPFKTIAINLLTIAASFGLVTAIFQAGPFGWESSDIAIMIPVFVFGLTFGISLDYGIFLLYRMAEIYRKTKDNDRAVLEGLATTGKIITSAAAIMIAVTAPFAMGEVTGVKQLGVGIALTIVIDATLVRLLLVPSLMKLMGRWNWWFPRNNRI